MNRFEAEETHMTITALITFLFFGLLLIGGLKISIFLHQHLDLDHISSKNNCNIDKNVRSDIENLARQAIDSNSVLQNELWDKFGPYHSSPKITVRDAKECLIMVTICGVTKDDERDLKYIKPRST